jgi:hypothetical protein
LSHDSKTLVVAGLVVEQLYNTEYISSEEPILSPISIKLQF